MDRLSSYPFWLLIFSVGCFLAERLWPWRKAQRQLRPGLINDLVFLVFNGTIIGALLYGIYSGFVEPSIVARLEGVGLYGVLFANVAAPWPLWAQIVVAMVVVDFLQWCVHNLLHRVPALWRIHQVHHSVDDGEMDFIVSFRFHWLEVVVYKSLLYVPLAVLGFRAEALFVHAVFGTLIGHLNHSNLDLGRGPLTYVFNSPRMHLWHHDYEPEAGRARNFGIIFSTWDWIFGTAHLPERSPSRIGYTGDEKMPRQFLSQLVWPLSELPWLASRRAVTIVLGALVLVLLWAASAPGEIERFIGKKPGGTEASSRPAKISAEAMVRPAALADMALVDFGAEASAAGWAHPEWMVSAQELETAIGSPRLVLLDARTHDRFVAGHIPGAQLVERDEYVASAPIPGLSKSADALIAMLEARGVGERSVIVIYGDGGAEPYRLWWTLHQIVGLDARLLDGGIQAWKARELPTVGGKEGPTPPGKLARRPRPRPKAERWAEVTEVLTSTPSTQLIDARTRAEFEGQERHPQAAKAGRIPGAHHLDWVAVLEGLDDPRLDAPATIKARLAAAAIDLDEPIIAYCQSGTRSAVLIFALLELGLPESRALNYGGSWSEYSRLSEPIEP